MSSSDFSDDEHVYLSYRSFWYKIREGPPLILKKSRLLFAAVNNDVETLKSLLDSPRWYKVRDLDGHNLLHIAILEDSKQVFDYLLSLDEFPLEAVDRDGRNAVLLAVLGKHEYYACELVKKGVDINNKEIYGSSLLHSAIDCEFITLTKLLLERGIDVNAQNSKGGTPLHLCTSSFYRYSDRDEMVAMLLCCGADPFVPNNDGYTPLEQLCKHLNYTRDNSGRTFEHLMYFSLDQWRGIKIPAMSLFHYAYKKSPPLEELIPFVTDVEFCVDIYDNWICIAYLLIMDTEDLKLLLKKFHSFIKFILRNYAWGISQTYESMFYEGLNIKNVDLLAQTFPLELSGFVSEIYSRKVLSYLTRSKKPTNEIIEIILCLLSYGMTWRPDDFESVYKLTGYSEDFKSLLHMDLCKCPMEYNDRCMSCDPSSPLHSNTQEPSDFQGNINIMFRLVCDVSLDVKRILEDSKLLENMDWETLFQYFAHPQLQQAYRQVTEQEFEKTNLPQVPLLQELARDAFRQHFVKVLQIKTPKQFFNFIKLLPISPAHEKIITFETKLYL